MLRIIVRELGREGPEGHGYERFYTIEISDGGKVARFLQDAECRTVTGIEVLEG